ncbi:RagB/SusD family nutrient uptake outer membrane protein [Anaerorudis cellulosivorans]|uniref:RagB/SusD family nutrient uptake outer membrane protein n=1 Tax=Anaerorudis cellulosivorans TaxID=3397862 RepID=UPI00221E4AED|nr:RagB/SusD family nutrient uptake outer membrane protein [Seramator thermalis]MCW1735106.1 RagB/SusD family nutrient uptake outer membrane protein [Seramator thermalis]
MKKFTLFLTLISFLFVASCSDKEDEELITPKSSVEIKGKVEKGPFVKGSEVKLYELDNSLKQTGVNYTTRIISDGGDFDFGELEVSSSYVLLTADGYYFNEVRGELSEGQLSLDALVDVSKQQDINVNILTHLKKERILTLIKEGKSFKDANRQAQQELLTCFALQEYADKDASTYSITAGTDEAAALIVISSIVLEDRSDAEVTEYLMRLSEEFKNTGTFSDEVKAEIREKSMQLSFESIEDHIIERYSELGKTIEVKDLSYYVDWDGDGIAGNELGDPDQERILRFETDTLHVAAAGGRYEVKIETNIPFSDHLPPTLRIPGTIIVDSRDLFKIGNIKCTASIESDRLILNVEPAESRIMNDTTFTIYSMDGKTSSQLVLVQEGDPNKPLELTQRGEDILATFCSKGRDAMNDFHILDALYTQLFSYGSKTDWKPIYEHQVNGTNFLVSATWAKSYQAIAALRQLKNAFQSEPLLYTSFAVLESMFYYEMAVWWGNVVYVSPEVSDDITISLPQMKIDELFALLESDLRKGIQLLPADNISFDAMQASSYLFYSNTVPKTILAKMYMYLGKYDKAYPLLTQIIQSGKYTLSNSRTNALSLTSKEIIYAFKQDPQSDYSRYIESTDIVPTLLYSEVVMLAAECAYRLGNNGKAVNYYNKMAESRGAATISSTTDFMSAMLSLWKNELKGTGTYFAFLKRNNLAEEVLNIPAYKQLLPIPESELMRNPYLVQNPEY